MRWSEIAWYYRSLLGIALGLIAGVAMYMKEGFMPFFHVFIIAVVLIFTGICYFQDQKKM